jgi:hypothetical protein
VAAKRDDTNRRRNAHGVVRAVKRDDLVGAVGVLGEGRGHRRPILDELANDTLAGGDQIAIGVTTIAGQISAPKQMLVSQGALTLSSRKRS